MLSGTGRGWLQGHVSPQSPGGVLGCRGPRGRVPVVFSSLQHGAGWAGTAQVLGEL